ncbi:MAG TPA: hypothetical protein PKK10_11605 [Woeseiaceae bacterium]|nr:hypothetical protein [Woeseiaceae bacterium]
MTKYQARAAAQICAEREERYAEMDWRIQMTQDQNARDLRAENARRMAAVQGG